MPKPPGNRVDGPIRGHRTRPAARESPPVRRPYRASIERLCIYNRDRCQDNVSVTVTVIFRVSRMRCSTQWCTAGPGSSWSRRTLCSEITKIPGLQRIIPLHFMLRCARETLDLRASLPGLSRQSRWSGHRLATGIGMAGTSPAMTAKDTRLDFICGAGLAVSRSARGEGASSCASRASLPTHPAPNPSRRNTV